MSQTRGRAAVLCAAIGAWGVLNGFAVCILWWQDTEGATRFVIGLAAAALASYVIETLRERLKPAEESHENDANAAARPSTLQRVARWLLTLVSLATFELFITAVDKSVAIFSDPERLIALRNAMLGPELAGGAASAKLDLIALAILWIVAGAALSAILAFVVFFPASDSVPKRQARGLAYGVAAGALVAPLVVLAYIVGVRIVLALGLLIFAPDQWKLHAEALAPSQCVIDATGTDNYVHVAVGFWAIAARIVGDLFVSGAGGKLAAFGILAGLIVLAWRVKNWWWPLAIFLTVLLASVFAPLAQDLGELATLPLLVAIVWAVPGALLGSIAPLLENPAERTTLWTSIATVIAFGVAIVTFATHQNANYLVGAAVLIAAGVILLRRDDLEIAWPVLAIAIALSTSSLNGVVLDRAASFHHVLTNVAHIDALPANIAADPTGILRDAILVPAEMQRSCASRDDFVGQFRGITARPPAERIAAVERVQRQLRDGRSALLARQVAQERRSVQLMPLALRRCRARPGLGFSNPLSGTRPPNVCIGAPLAQIAALSLLGAGVDGRATDAAIEARIDADLRGIDMLRAHLPLAQLGYGYSIWNELQDAEYTARVRVQDIVQLDADLALVPLADPPEPAPPAEPTATGAEGEKKVPKSPYELPIVLELSIAGSVAFWITVALLATWQSRRDEETPVAETLPPSEA